MNIYLDPCFLRSYKKLTKKNPHLKSIIKNKIKLFQENPNNPSLRLHKLLGKKVNQWSLAVRTNLRILFVYSGEDVILTNIGSHDEVY